jgi:hypothetical protein
MSEDSPDWTGQAETEGVSFKLACHSSASGVPVKNLKYWAWLILVGGIFGLAVGRLLLPCHSEPEIVRVFRHKYKQVHNRMTREQVESILGKPDAVTNETWKILASREGPASESVLDELFFRNLPEPDEVVFILVFFDKDGLVVKKEIGRS